jgi:hypothetical protein
MEAPESRTFFEACAASFSDADLNDKFPVTRRIRLARLHRIFGPLVSGRQKKQKTSVKPDIHISSQIDQLQSFSITAKPPMSGPRVGPQIATAPHIPMA